MYFRKSGFDRKAFLTFAASFSLNSFRIFKIKCSNFTKEYVLSMYWSAMTLTTLGEQVSISISE